MDDRQPLEERVNIYDRLNAFAQSNLRVAQISRDDSMMMYHAGYHAALEDIAKSLGLAVHIKAYQLPVVVKGVK